MEYREITPSELLEFNGRNGKPAYVALDGKVYDVSESFSWTDGRHQELHDAGLDLSGEIAEAPHGDEMLKSYPQVGVLKRE